MPEALRRQINRGEALLAEANVVAVEQDLRFWETRVQTWVADVTSALGGEMSGPELHSFARAVQRPALDGGVHEVLPVALECVRAGIALLRDREARGVPSQ